ncbi:hypothetical protein E4U42_004490 [Claviceps africana]|uniref:Uncharacterized protein n=1 Tax=Claviceps africana TaxID=83212 RepID=A0A8K0NI61_9HYPO|nr:hypothetical protein E4U42_004490 [Claviceps africana]
MQFTSLLSVLVASSACLVCAAPFGKRETNMGGLAGPLGGLMGGSGAAGAGSGAQDVAAEFFKLGDAFLNIPGDAVQGGNPLSALTNLAKTGASLPGDAAKAGKDTMGQ